MSLFVVKRKNFQLSHDIHDTHDIHDIHDIRSGLGNKSKQLIGRFTRKAVK